jgi:hypothetical protein
MIEEETKMKKVLTTLVTGSILLFSMTAFALTENEAKTNIDRQAAEKKLNAQDHSQAVNTLQGLVDKGVPVDHAYRVVEASINQGRKGQDLAEVARSIEAAEPGARKDAALVAAEAIQHKYTTRETVQMTNTFSKTVAAGAPVDKTSQVMSNGIDKGVGAAKITAATNAYAGEIKSGTAPDKAADNATRTMDKDRTRQHDRDMLHDRDHMGTGPGMDHGGMGMDHGSGMGPGMGGPKR